VGDYSREEEMKKMTDEQIDRHATDYAPQEVDVQIGIIEGMKEARDFYDAQIDAQAKTMDELAKIFENTDWKNGWDDAVLTYGTTRWKSGKEGFAFALQVAFFLAAGGVIKK
jgi:hypothetical protein